MMDFEKDFVTEDEISSMTPEHIEELIFARDYKTLKSEAEGLPAVDIAAVLEELSAKDRIFLYRLLNKDFAAEVFVEMSTAASLELIGAFTDKELKQTLEEVYLDDVVDIIEEMPAAVVKRILAQSSPEDRASINALLKYPAHSAGGIMTTEYVRLSLDMTVGDALRHIREVALDKETVYTCYITDKERHLLGIVTVKDLLINPEDTPLADIIFKNIIFAETDEDRESVAHKFAKYGLTALPVVDSETRLVGIVTVDDAISVLDEEADEDIAMITGITPQDEEYLKTPVFSIYKARIPWLLLLMISATLSSTILGFFENSLIPVLVLFVPMLMDCGGNSGSQASVSIIRAIGTGDVKFSDILFVLFREIRVGFMCSVTLAAAAFCKVMLIDRLIMNNPAVSLSVALAVALTLGATIMLAKIIGASLPLIASKIGLDPAVMASPFITTSVDAISLMVYFLIAGGVFGLTL